MCQIDENFKLCSCENGEGAYPNTWLLKRYDGADWMSLTIGRFLLPRYTEADTFNALLIAKNLNSRSCFDTNFSYQEGDVLILNFNDIKYQQRFAFAFQAGKWEESRDVSNMDAHLIILKGKIGN